MPTGRCLLKEHRVYLGTRPIPITLFSVQRELHSRIREFTSRRGVLVAIRYKDEGKQMFGITEGRYVVLSLSYTQPELDSCLPKSSDLAAFICQAATAACQDGRCLEALGMAQRALTVKAECAQAHFLVGTAVDELGLFNDAIREYQSALRINPDFVEAHHNLGIVYGKHSRTDDAIREFHAALHINPNLARPHYGLGQVYLQQPLADLASPRSNRAKSSEGKSPHIRGESATFSQILGCPSQQNTLSDNKSLRVRNPHIYGHASGQDDTVKCRDLLNKMVRRRH